MSTGWRTPIVGPTGPAGAAGPRGPSAIHLLIVTTTELAIDLYVPVILPGGCTVTGMSAAASYDIVGTNLNVVLAQANDGPSLALKAGTGSYITVHSTAEPWVFPFGPAPTVTSLRLTVPAESSGHVAVSIDYTPA